jgi:hypothetical protein
MALDAQSEYLLCDITPQAGQHKIKIEKEPNDTQMMAKV